MTYFKIRTVNNPHQIFIFRELEKQTKKYIFGTFSKKVPPETLLVQLDMNVV